MLQIYVYGPQEQGFLDLNPGTSLEIESLAEAFDEDLSIGEYSLPVEVPWTEKNRRLLGFTERLANFSSKQPYFRCTAYDGMVPEIPIGKLTILEKNGNFTYTKGSFNASVSGGKGLFGSLIKNRKLRSFYLDGPIVFNTESRKFAEDVMKGVVATYPYISFAPVAIENFIDSQRKDYNGEFLVKDCVNNVIVTGAGPDDWTFDRPDPFNPSIPCNYLDINRKNYWTVPFFNLMWVFKKVFEELGYSLIGEFANTSDFDNLHIFNNVGIEYYFLDATADGNRTIHPTEHLPDLLASEFIKYTLDLFNVFPTFPHNNEVKLEYRVTNLKQKKILDIAGIVSSEFNNTFEEQSTDRDGYKLALKWDANDQYFSERVKDLSDKIIAGTVTTVANLATFNPGYSLTTDHVVYVEADNLYYQVANAVTVPVLFDAYAERLNDYEKGGAERSVDINVSTLCTYCEFDTALALMVRRDYVGTRQPGTYRAYSGILVSNKFDFRVFYISKRSIGGVNIPVSYNHNKDIDNNVIEKYSLSWPGNTGLAQLHIAWQDLREKAEILKTNISVDQKSLADLGDYNTYEVNNVLFVPYRINRRIPLSNETELRVVPL